MTISIAKPPPKETQPSRRLTTKAISKSPLDRTRCSANASSESVHLHSDKEIKDLLQQLADMAISREEREKLHSRLLAGLPDKTTIGDMSCKLIGSPQAKQGAESQPRSHFSDSSGDEDEDEASAETSTVYYRSREGHRTTLVSHKQQPANKEPSTTTTVFDIDL